MKSSPFSTWLSLLILVLLGGVCHAQGPCTERYFVLIFGSQPTNRDPHRSHTWGTMVKTSEWNGAVQFEAHTISWIPADFRVKLLTICSKPGINLDLMSTINRYQMLNCKVSLWGPYEIQDGSGPSLWERALNQIARLESGEVRYMAIDPDFGPRARTVSDCIHAITDIDQQQGRTFYSEFFRYGERASEFIVGILTQRGRINRGVTHDWVLAGLGLADAGLTRR